MDVHPKYQVVARDAGRVKEPQEKSDQRRIAVDEGHSLDMAVRLALGAFAPVGHSPGDEDLAIGDGADLGRGAPGHRCAACPTGGSFDYRREPSAERLRFSS